MTSACMARRDMVSSFDGDEKEAFAVRALSRTTGPLPIRAGLLVTAGGTTYKINTASPGVASIGSYDGSIEGSYGVLAETGSAVPETATWLAMMIGFVAIGALLRRRQPMEASAF